MKLDRDTIAWIEEAIAISPHGKITLNMQDGRIMKILTESKKEINKLDKIKNKF